MKLPLTAAPNAALTVPLDSHRLKRYLLRQQTCGQPLECEEESFGGGTEMAKPLSAVDCIGPAFNQTKNQLFVPFRLARWARLALICLITGEFAGGGGGGGAPPGGFNFPIPPSKGGKEWLALSPFDWSKTLPWLPWILAGVILVTVFIVLWVYVASVFRFVLLDSVLYDRCELKGSWTRWEPSGRSYFYWSVALFFAAAIGSGLVVGAPLLIAWRAGLFHHPGHHLAALILGGAALLFVLIAFFVLSAIAGLFAKDFCIPIMAMEKVGVLDGWRRLLPMLAVEKLAFTGYVLMKIVLAIGSAIIFGIITFLAIILMFIPLGIAGVLIFLGGRALGLTLNATTISILVVMGAMILAGILYLIALISTPAMVFFQSYMLHFLGSRYPILGAAVFPPPQEAPPSAAPGISPPLGGPPLIEPSIG